MSKADPWMPLYVGDYLSDTMHLVAQEHGAYLLLLMHYWRNGPLPDDDRALAGIARVDREVWSTDTGPIIRAFFKVKAGKLHQARMDIERDKSAELIGKRRAAANIRHKKKGDGEEGEGGGGGAGGGGAGPKRGGGNSKSSAHAPASASPHAPPHAHAPASPHGYAPAPAPAPASGYAHGHAKFPPNTQREMPLSHSVQSATVVPLFQANEDTQPISAGCEEISCMSDAHAPPPALPHADAHGHANTVHVDMLRGGTRAIVPQSHKGRAEAYASDAPQRVAPIDARDAVWQRGLPIIASLTGKPTHACRSILGKLVKTAADDCARVLAVLERADDLRPIDPMAWIIAAVQDRATNRIAKRDDDVLRAVGLEPSEHADDAPAPTRSMLR